MPDQGRQARSSREQTMNVSSKSINASDLDAVYDYFDDVVNKLIRTEVDVEEFPVLTDFVTRLAELIDKLDELVDDVNPRVEEYLTNKKNEEELRNQMEMMQQQLAELQKERRERFGSDGGESPSSGGADIYDWSSASGKGSAVLESPGLIDFDTDIEDMIGDVETDIAFSDEEEEERLRQREEERRRREEEAADELLREALDTIPPIDALGGALEMKKLGDYYKDLEPEEGLYDDDDEPEDDDDDDMFAGAYGQSYGDFRYEDDAPDASDAPGAGADDDIGSQGYFDDRDEGAGDGLPGGYDDGYDSPYGDGYGNPGYDDGYDDAPRGRPDDDAEDDAWDDADDPLQGRNIDQLLSSASMTI